ncbi:MAG: VWA domain-containing protein [Acidobacteria bacterium]|nr:VWA domain-containing protein [Acidobacteriota bacterium]
MTRRRWIQLAGGVPLLCRAQDAVFKTDVKVVNVLAAVRTRKGEFVRDLDRDDFTIAEDGRAQQVRYFARQSDLPLTIGLLIDTSMSQQKVLGAERGASFRFIDRVLREATDKVFLMQFDMVAQVKQELTSSRRLLDDALAYVDTPAMRDLQLQRGGGTLLYDAVVEASRDVMAKRTGRKALIVMTDGVDTGSESSLSNAVDAAARADTLIYSIYFTDAGYYGGFGEGVNGRKVLTRMSQDTGGAFFEVTRKLGIDQVFEVIQDELRSQYSIGYVSDKPVLISEFRRIQLSVRRKGLTVQARERYWARR